MRIRKGDGLILLGMLLIFAAGALTVWNMYDENRARQSAETVIEQLQEIQQKTEEMYIRSEDRLILFEDKKEK